MKMLEKLLKSKEEGYDVLSLSITDELYQFYIGKRINGEELEIIGNFCYEYLSEVEPEAPVFEVVLSTLDSIKNGTITYEILKNLSAEQIGEKIGLLDNNHKNMDAFTSITVYEDSGDSSDEGYTFIICKSDEELFNEIVEEVPTHNGYFYVNLIDRLSKAGIKYTESYSTIYCDDNPSDDEDEECDEDDKCF